jgi:hypothetical protein
MANYRVEPIFDATEITGYAVFRDALLGPSESVAWFPLDQRSQAEAVATQRRQADVQAGFD